jgi:hypothetical protein
MNRITLAERDRGLALSSRKSWADCRQHCE